MHLPLTSSFSVTICFEVLVLRSIHSRLESFEFCHHIGCVCSDALGSVGVQIAILTINSIVQPNVESVRGKRLLYSSMIIFVDSLVRNCFFSWKWKQAEKLAKFLHY